jgi:putative Mg2+ transporter-C (MgtC) family protein
MSLELDIVMRLLLAAVLGAGIGYQRDVAGKPAGLRTHISISMGAALFTVVSIFGFGDVADHSRVASGVVAGVGFIGAGVIFRSMHEGVVAGVTSAAIIWVTAAIGLATGAGLYLIAAIVTLITVITMLLPKIRG